MSGNARASAAAIGLFLFTKCLFAVTGNRRSLVSTTGADRNACTRDLPCRNFDAAINNTVAGGEVVALDSGGYGKITSITKSIAIIAPLGIHAAMSVFSGDGI